MLLHGCTARSSGILRLVGFKRLTQRKEELILIVLFVLMEIYSIHIQETGCVLISVL